MTGIRKTHNVFNKSYVSPPPQGNTSTLKFDLSEVQCNSSFLPVKGTPEEQTQASGHRHIAYSALRSVTPVTYKVLTGSKNVCRF